MPNVAKSLNDNLPTISAVALRYAEPLRILRRTHASDFLEASSHCVCTSESNKHRDLIKALGRLFQLPLDGLDSQRLNVFRWRFARDFWELSDKISNAHIALFSEDFDSQIIC
jgi:hypothetical protein